MTPKKYITKQFQTTQGGLLNASVIYIYVLENNLGPIGHGLPEMNLPGTICSGAHMVFHPTIDAFKLHQNIE